MRQNRPLFIGITGGIGAGKTELLSYIGKHYKCEIYLADEVAHKVKEPGTDCYRKLLALLGTDILSEDGQIDRRRMADRIFSSPELLEETNKILHPAVRVYLLERLQEARRSGETELFFVEAALLVECGYGNLVDEMWYVYADQEVRRARLRASRGYSRERIDGIMSKQLSDEQFRESCDFIIDNSGSLEDSRRQIDRKLEAFTWQK